MALNKENLITTIYTPEQDILYAAWLEHRPYCAAEVKKAFMDVVSSAREQNTKRVMLNFADNTQTLTAQEYKDVLAQLSVGLKPTTIKKIACIGTKDDARKHLIMEAYQSINAAIEMPILLQVFSNRAEALQWLLED